MRSGFLRMGRSKGDDRSAELRKVLGDAALPAIPELVTAAIEQVSAPDCDLREVADTIGLDPGISARLLSIANSAAYAPRNPVVGVRQAVTMLGKNRLESMLISLAVSSAVARRPIPGFDMGQFWRTAAWRASAAGILSRRVDRGRSNVNFSAALLENIAVPVLLSNEPRYAAVHTAWRSGEGNLDELEHAAFGWTHFDVAGWLFDEWGFPQPLRDAVIDAGRPEDGSAEYPVVRLVSRLSEPKPQAELVDTTARGIEEVYGLPYDEGVRLLETARVDGAHLARHLA